MTAERASHLFIRGTEREILRDVYTRTCIRHLDIVTVSRQAIDLLTDESISTTTAANVRDLRICYTWHSKGTAAT